MSLDLYQQEINDRLTAMPPVSNVEPAMFDGFIRGTGLATMKGLAKTGRAIDLLGSVAPIIQDAFTGGTEAQDKYFKEHDEIYGRAVDYWTPKSNEIGSAAEIMGSLLTVIPQVIASPGLAVATTQLATAEDLVNTGVTAGTANVVGAVQGLTLGTGIWMPILGKNLWQRTLIGGAGFNAAQGIVARGISGAILEDTPAKDMFKAFDAEALTLDVLLGLAFGNLVHLSPAQRAQGTDAWNKIESWAKNLSPSDKAAISVLREAQHLNVDSTPGKPVDAPTIEAHVQRMRAAIDQMAKDQPVQIEDITIPRTTIPIEEAPPQVRQLLDQEQQLREEFTEATASRDEALGRNDEEGAALWNKELERISTELQDVSVKRTEMWDPERPAEQPRYEPDPERGAETEAMAAAFREDAKVVMAEEGLAPPPQEPPRVTQSVRRTIEEQLTAAGRPVEEASAGAAIWNAFYTTMAKRIGTTVDQLWNQFPLTRITREAPDAAALNASMKQGPDGEPMLSVDGKLRPITNADGRRIAESIQELKNFWNWFKDSQVAKDGKPMAMYHGSRAGGFSVFMRGSNGYMYFTQDPAYASSFAGAPTSRYNEATVYPVYLAIKKPIDLTGFGERDNVTGAEFDDALRQNGVNTEGLNLAKRSPSMAWSWIKDPNLKFRLEDSGFDGIKMIENTSRAENRPQGSTVYVAFQPEQIKSAIGNRGTFDPKNPDILYQKGRRKTYKDLTVDEAQQLPSDELDAAIQYFIGRSNLDARGGYKDDAGMMLDYLEDLREQRRQDGTLYQNDTWYKSALGEAITKLNMKAAPAKGWLDALKGMVGKNNVKADEIKWSGVEEWLQLQEGRVTKEQVQDFLANNGVKVEEVMLGGYGNRTPRDQTVAGDVAMLEAAGWKVDTNPDDPGRYMFIDPQTEDYISAGEIRQFAEEQTIPGPNGTKMPNTEFPPIPPDVVDAAGRVERYLNAGTEGVRPTKFGTYQLPGGENYRELLLTLPEKTQTELPVGWRLKNQANGWVLVDATGTGEFLPISPSDTEAMAISEAMLVLRRRGIKEGAAGAFQSSHFDTPNILAHIRFNERTDADGKRVLFIEEFQSDWAQKGKKEGFSDIKRLAEVQARLAEMRGLPAEGKWTPELEKEETTLIGERDRLQEQRIPAAPFVGKTDAWVALTLKRMIAYAAENGFDKIAWTRGEQQVERYTSALRKAVDVIEWTKTDKGVQLVGYKGMQGQRPIDTAIRNDAREVVEASDFLGFDSATAALENLWQHRDDWQTRWEVPPGAHTEIINAYLQERQAAMGERARQKVVDTTEKEDALSDAIGKAMAEKIISDPNQTGTIKGEGIRIDSTGMAGFYDRIVPKVAKEVLKNLRGGKVGEVRLPMAKDSKNTLGYSMAYEGPTPTAEDIAVIRNATSAYGPDNMINPLNGQRLMFAINRVGPAQSLRAIEREMAAGRTFEEAMAIEGSGEVAEYFGGAMKQVPLATEQASQTGFDITPEMKKAVEGGLPLFQKGQDGARGYMSIGPEGRIIGLLEGANASTFVHESGHFFLDTLNDISRLPDVPAAIREDLDIALKWTGVEDPAKWADMSLDEKRPYHEKWARGFEQYLREGKAPSEELRGVFQRFRDWLVEIYKSAKQLNVKLNDDIRGVMNRMLADQVRNPSTEAPLAPVERPGSPPPPRAGEEAPAGPTGKDDPAVRQILEVMAAEETGWAQEGGKLLDQGELGTGKPSFTTWIPKAEWWPERPDKKLNAPKVQEAVRKYLAGEKLKPAEQRTVDYMLKLADERNRGIDTVGGEEEYQALARDADLEGLDYTTENIVDLDLVARAAAINEDIVERAARMYPNDDAAFRGELEMAIYEHETQQAAEAAGRSQKSQPTQEQPAGEAKAEPNAIRDAADRIVAEQPNLMLTIGINADGTPMTIRAADFLEQERAIADAAREDVGLFEAAATCLFGG